MQRHTLIKSRHSVLPFRPGPPTWCQRPRCRLVPQHPLSQLATSVRQGSASTSSGPVEIDIRPAPSNSRKIHAAIVIHAPVNSVWDALTNFEALHTFIPGLTQNKCLERWCGGAKLLQVGETDIFPGLPGFKFSARCTLMVEEHEAGVPEDWRSSEVIISRKSPMLRGGFGYSRGSGSSSSSSGYESDESLKGGLGRRVGGRSCREISFHALDGDFQVFKGLWRMQPASGPDSTILSYSLFVRPQIWLPVQLVQSRIEREIVANLKAVQTFVEGRWNAEQSNGAPGR